MTTRIQMILSVSFNLGFVAQSTIIQIQKRDDSRTSTKPMSPHPPRTKKPSIHTLPLTRIEATNRRSGLEFSEILQ